MVFYKILANGDIKIITNINPTSKVKSAYTDMQEIDAATVKKYKLTSGMYIDDVMKIDKNILACADSVAVYIGDYVKIDSLKDDCLYFDSEYHKIYNKRSVDIWSEEYIWSVNGLNVTFARIIDEVEVNAKKTNTEYYDTYTVYSYETNKGIIKVESYPGDFDTVVEGKDILGF